MRVFSIEGKFQQNGRYSNLLADFEGYFVLDKSKRIRGYTEEKYATQFNHHRYIYGQYDEKRNNLVFLKMSTGHELSPLLYCFPDLEIDGCWTEFSPMFKGFFPWGQKEKAKVTIRKETTKNPNEVLAIYQEIIDDGWELNIALMQFGVERFMGDISRFIF